MRLGLLLLLVVALFVCDVASHRRRVRVYRHKRVYRHVRVYRHAHFKRMTSYRQIGRRYSWVFRRSHFMRTTARVQCHYIMRRIHRRITIRKVRYQRFLRSVAIKRCWRRQKQIIVHYLSRYRSMCKIRRRRLIARQLITLKLRQYHLQSQAAWMAIQHSHLLYRTIVWGLIQRSVRVVHVIASHHRIIYARQVIWVQRFLMGVHYRRQVTFRTCLVGVRGLMTSATKIATGFVSNFIHVTRVKISSQIKSIYHTFFHKSQLYYTTYAHHMYVMKIGRLRFGFKKYMSTWNLLYQLVFRVITGHLDVRSFIVQLQMYPSYLSVIQSYIYQIAHMYGRKLLRMARYRMQLQALFYFYSRMYFLCLIRQTVIAGGAIHTTTYIAMRNSLAVFYKLIQIFIVPPKRNPHQHIPLPPWKPFPPPQRPRPRPFPPRPRPLPPRPRPMPPKPKPRPPLPRPRPPLPKPRPPTGSGGGLVLEGEISINFNGEKRTVRLANAGKFVKEVFGSVKTSMSELLLSVVESKHKIHTVIDAAHNVAGNMQILVTIYKFIRCHQTHKKMFVIYNTLKTDTTAAFDFIEKTIIAEMKKSDTEAALLKKVEDTFQATIDLYDLLRAAYLGSVEDKETFMKQFKALYNGNANTIMSVLRSGLHAKGDAREGISLLAAAYALAKFEELSYSAWSSTK